MKRFDANVGSRNAALEKAPEVLKAIRVNSPVNILHGVIHNLVGIVSGQSLVRTERIRVQRRSCFDVLADFRLQSVLLAVRYDRGANLPAALQDSHNSGLVLRASTSDAAFTFTNVHVPSLAADEGLVYFNFSTTAVATKFLAEKVILQSQAETLQHKPCRLLGNSQSAVDFHAAHTILTIHQHPESGHPLIESQRGVLENGSQLKSELLLAGVAEPDAASLDKRVLFGAATWTGHFTIRPAKALGVVESALRITEVNDCFLQCFRSVHA